MLSDMGRGLVNLLPQQSILCVGSMHQGVTLNRETQPYGSPQLQLQE
jgi:hypothetical protein